VPLTARVPSRHTRLPPQPSLRAWVAMANPQALVVPLAAKTPLETVETPRAVLVLAALVPHRLPALETWFPSPEPWVCWASLLPPCSCYDQMACDVPGFACTNVGLSLQALLYRSHLQKSPLDRGGVIGAVEKMATALYERPLRKWPGVHHSWGMG
jgi:hypothetical protein